MKYFSLLFAFLFMVSCHSQQKPSESQPKAQDSIQVEQLELPPLESGMVEYKDDEAFGEVIELEGRQFVPDSFIFRPSNAKMVVKGKYLIMRVDVFSQDLHPFIIFDYPGMTYVTEVGKYGNGPDEFIFGDIIPTTDPNCLCYLMEITRDKLYKLTRKGEIVPYPYSFQSSAYKENFKEYIHNIGKNDFIYTDKSKSGRSIFCSYPEGDSIVCKELCSLQVDPELKSPFAYTGDFAVNPEKDRMAFAYKYYKKLKFMTMDASVIKDIDYDRQKFEEKTLHKVDGLDYNLTHYWGISGCDDYVYLVYSGRTPREVTAEWNEDNVYIYVEQYDWNGNPIRKYRLKDFFGYIYVDEDRGTILGVSTVYDDPYVEFKLPE